MEQFPSAVTSEKKEKKESDPRLKKVLDVVKRTLITAGIVGIYGAAITVEVNRGLERRRERLVSERRTERLAEEYKAEHADDELIRAGRVDAIHTKEGNLSAETIHAVMEQGFPKGWFDDVAVVQSEEELSMAAYNMTGNAFASCSGRSNGSLIRFYRKESEVNGTFMAGRVLAHESCHAVEQRLARQSPKDHEDLMRSLKYRVGQPSRFRSGYVESISNSDEQARTHNKSVEYFAEVCEQYFTSPGELPVTEFHAMDTVVKLYDPSFNPTEARQVRQRLLSGVQQPTAPKLAQTNQKTGEL